MLQWKHPGLQHRWSQVRTPLPEPPEPDQAERRLGQRQATGGVAASHRAWAVAGRTAAGARNRGGGGGNLFDFDLILMGRGDDNNVAPNVIQNAYELLPQEADDTQCDWIRLRCDVWMPSPPRCMLVLRLDLSLRHTPLSNRFTPQVN